MGGTIKCTSEKKRKKKGENYIRQSLDPFVSIQVRPTQTQSNAIFLNIKKKKEKDFALNVWSANF